MIDMTEQAGIPWLSRMAPAAPDPVITERHLTQLDVEVQHYESVVRAHAAARDRAAFTREFLTPRLGRPASEVRADITAALEQAERDLAAAKAAVEAAEMRLRDYEGYIRVLRDRHPELAAQEGASPLEDAAAAH